MNQSLNNFLNSLKGKPLEQANKEAESVCGIVDFFDDYKSFFHSLREWILEMDDPKIPYAGILIWWLKKHIK